ncbi:MAG: CHAT domain-containing protein [Scytonema sp. PMC 1069.18]|nr:CHAT domain-containing protein [Scytonema sp. PMC 1069.18]MEC4886542.1 CHAT domain-containing protein [Scytonema sp. PMC 1070.18]
MELLRLCLSPINKRHFKISAYSNAGEGETESTLPFFENDIDLLNTVIKTLDAVDFSLTHFKQEELDWMIRLNLLKEDRSAFHPNLLANIGHHLFQALFPAASQVEKILERAITLSEDRHTQLHIQFQFHANSEQPYRLLYYPWELVHNGQKFLAQERVTFSRYIAHRSTPPNLPPVDKVNVLLISSAAFDLENKLKPFSSSEQQAIRKGIDKAKRKKLVSLTKLKMAKFNELRVYLTENRDNKAPHVIHFDGHGIYGKRCTFDKCRKINPGIKIEKCKWCGSSLTSPEGYLIFEDDEGQADYVSASKFGDLIQQTSFGNEKQRGVFLVVLSACKSGMALAGDSDFNGIAQNLISRQVPAVVAMQYLISIPAATAFAEQFYRSLGQRNLLATAVSHAREAMGFDSNQWYRPVLYLRWKDNEGGTLFTESSASVSSYQIEQVIQHLANQRDSVTSTEVSVELSNAVDEVVESVIKPTQFLNRAEIWLEDENFRWELASKLAKKTLKVENLRIYKSSQAKKQAKDRYQVNLYNCLNWLLEAFQTWQAKEIDKFYKDLSEFPWQLYIEALNIFKEIASKDVNDRNVVRIIHLYVNILIDKINQFK